LIRIFLSCRNTPRRDIQEVNSNNFVLRGLRGEAFMAAQSGKRETVLTIRVVPGSSVNKIVASEEGALRVKLTAPAVEGRANEALIAFLAKRLRVPKGKVTIVSGPFSRVKRVRVEGVSETEVLGLLSVEG
jgi:uncharacterized protein (TIGR00251 family)